MAQCRLGILPLEIETGRYAPYVIDIEKNRKRYPSERVSYVALENVKMKYILCLRVLYMT